MFLLLCLLFPVSVVSVCGFCGEKRAHLQCSSCKCVKYCSKNCQTEHWPEHKKECGKSKAKVSEPEHTAEEEDLSEEMKGLFSPAKTDLEFFCCRCGRPGARKKCGRCNLQRYCGPKCQDEHWSFHKKHCKSLQLQNSAEELERNPERKQILKQLKKGSLEDHRELSERLFAGYMQAHGEGFDDVAAKVLEAASAHISATSMTEEQKELQKKEISDFLKTLKK
jgi:hypothetical protein